MSGWKAPLSMAWSCCRPVEKGLEMDYQILEMTTYLDSFSFKANNVSLKEPIKTIGLILF